MSSQAKGTRTFVLAAFAAALVLASVAGVAAGQTITIGDILAANYGAGTVYHYSGQTGALLGSVATGLNGVSGVVFLDDGDLAVAESGADRILRYDGDTGAYKGIICDSAINNPRGIAVGLAGELWIADLINGAAVAVNPSTGAELLRLPVSRPMGVAIGNGRVYVTKQDATVRHFDYATGTDLGILAQGFGSSLEAIVVTPDGSVIVNCTPGLFRLDWQTGAVLASHAGFGGEGLALGDDGLLYAGYWSDSPNYLARVDPLSLDIIGPVVVNYSGTHGIALKPVPEPATLALLALGGLAVLWRRRQ